MQKNEMNEECAVQDETDADTGDRRAATRFWRRSAPGRPIDKVFVLDGCQDGPVRTIVRRGEKT